MKSAEALSLVLFYLGAFLSPLLAGRLGLPAAVAEILYGLVLGQSGLRLLQRTSFIDFLAQLGFIFLMFLVGMEIDFNQLKRQGRGRLLLAAGVAGAILLSGILLARLAGLAPFLGLALGAMSVGVLLVVLAESGRLREPLGQTFLLVGSIGELLTLVGLTGYDLGHRFGLSLALVGQVLKAMLLFAAVYIVLVVLRLLVWWAPHAFQRLVRAHDTSEVGVRAGFVLMLSMAALATLVGLEAILGAFLAGALFSFVFRGRGTLEVKFSAVAQGFFVPIFFIHVGVGFDASALGDPREVGSQVLQLLGLALLARLPTLLLATAGLPLRQVMGGALLLAAPLTLLVAVAALGRELGLLDARTQSSVILLAMLSGVIFPVGFRLLMRVGAVRGGPGAKQPHVIMP